MGSTYTNADSLDKEFAECDEIPPDKAGLSPIFPPTNARGGGMNEVRLADVVEALWQSGTSAGEVGIAGRSAEWI